MASSPQFESEGITPSAASRDKIESAELGYSESREKFERVHSAKASTVETEAAGELSEGKRLIGPAREMMRYRALVARTVDVFGDEIKASRWLSLPNQDFSGQTPLQVAQRSGYDLRAIEPILIRIEHGVYY